MSNITGEDGGSFSFSSENNTVEEEVKQQRHSLFTQPTAAAAATTAATANNKKSATSQPPALPVKKKRNLPGTPDPTADVIVLSPTTLMATNRFVCEICNKGFQRDQNLQLHRRGHNLPWKLKQRTSTEVRKRVYVCPEPTCVHHDPSRALGDLTGIKKHFGRKHGEKKWKCDKCSKKYAVRSDWRAHSKTCGTKEYKCGCGTIFSRRDSFITHGAFCDALAGENKLNQGPMNPNLQLPVPDLMMPLGIPDSFNNQDASWRPAVVKTLPHELPPAPPKPHNMAESLFSTARRGHTGAFDGIGVKASAHMSATALLQRAALMGATASNTIGSSMMQQREFVSGMAVHDHRTYEGMRTQMVGIDGGGISNQYFDASVGDGSPSAEMYRGQESCGGGGSLLKGVRIGGGETMTVDYLGVGRSSSAVRIQQLQQGIEEYYEGGIQGLHPLKQLRRPGDLEKRMWDV